MNWSFNPFLSSYWLLWSGKKKLLLV